MSEPEDNYVYYNGRKLRKGYTTGTTATMTSLAGAKAILDQKAPAIVKVNSANGTPVQFDVQDCTFRPQPRQRCHQKRWR